MPELPEVQTIVDGLNKKVLGRKVVSAWFDWSKLKAVERTIGFSIKKVARKGKNILFYLSDDKILLVHQKMTGHILVGKWEMGGKKITPLEPSSLKEKVNGYIHFILTLDNGQMVALSDLRKFAKVIFGSVKEIENLSELKKLGPDALDSKLEFQDFIKIIKSKNKTIYQVLMDQTVVAGIGNIYSSDILWEAKVFPFKSAKKLSEGEVKRIYLAMKKVLKKALELRGTSVSDYRDIDGKSGFYGDKRLIYKREKEPCKRCKTKIIRSKKGGRSAYYCPNCQVL